MRQSRLVILGAVVVLGTTLPRAWTGDQAATTPQPSAGQLLVTSDPSGLQVFLERHETVPKTNLLRTGGIEDDKPRGKTPLLLDLSPGEYTIAAEHSLPAEQASQVPRGCRGGFSFSGGAVFFGCFKCNSYPDATHRDSLDPYARDGNIGVCFHAPEDDKAPVRYFRVYKLSKGDTAARLDTKLKLAAK